jgi:geranylgeranyl pyrophosphate synthase
LRKNFYKTASLMANSCKSAALLGSYSRDLVLASYRYGKHVGMAFQLVDDSLDFEGTLSQLGKPSLADLKAGLATAPVLFAAQEFSELYPLMDRKFREEGDVERAVELVFASKGLERTKDLARAHAEAAMDSILTLKASDHRDSLVQLANAVVARTK